MCGMLACVCTQAQKVAYSYDSGGNRVLKRIIVVTSEAKAAMDCFIDDEETTEVESIGVDDGFAIKSSEDGRICISISEELWQGSATVSVHDASGRQVLATQSTVRETVINLSDQSAGIYVLTVKTGRRTRTWRIAIQ